MSVLKAEGSIVASLAVMTAVYGIYSHGLPSVADIRTAEPGNHDIEASERAASWQAAGAVPLFDLNTVTYHGAIGSAARNAALLAQQLRLLRAASAAGLPVRMVELGNELYLNGNSSTPAGHAHDYAKRFPTAAAYATQMNPWIAAIHRAFPGPRWRPWPPTPTTSAASHRAAARGTPACWPGLTGRTR